MEGRKREVNGTVACTRLSIEYVDNASHGKKFENSIPCESGLEDTG